MANDVVTRDRNPAHDGDSIAKEEGRDGGETQVRALARAVVLELRRPIEMEPQDEVAVLSRRVADLETIVEYAGYTLLGLGILIWLLRK